MIGIGRPGTSVPIGLAVAILPVTSTRTNVTARVVEVLTASNVVAVNHWR